MKKIIVFVFIFVFSLGLFPRNFVYASEQDDFMLYKQTIDDWVGSRFDLSQYSYFVIQSYSVDDVVTVGVLYSKVPLSYCTKYLGNSNGCLGSFHPYNSTDTGNAYKHVKESDTKFVRMTNGAIELRSSTYDWSYKGYVGAGFEYLGTFTNHDIYNFETGDLVFWKALRLTELAGIVEQANRQQTPMIQILKIIPIVIPIVACLMGLRKCLNLLGHLFYKA